MAVRVMIKRHLKAGQTEAVLAILNSLRSLAMNQKGYISGETLVSHYDKKVIMVVSTWQTVEDWINWQESEARDAQEALVEELLDAPAVYDIYDLGM